MAYLVAKCLVGEALVPILRSAMDESAATAKLAELATFPGQVAQDVIETTGELWFEIETDDGDLVGDPVCFAADHAQATLIRTGMRPAQALRALVVVALSDVARGALDDIQRSCETPAEALNRILETLAASAPDFDHVYGEPRDGRGPSGE